MTNDDKMIGTFKSLSVAAEGIIREAFRKRAEWKKQQAEAQTIPAPGEAVGSVRKGK